VAVARIALWQRNGRCGLARYCTYRRDRPIPLRGAHKQLFSKTCYTYTQLLYLAPKYTIDMKKLHTSITIIVLTLNLDFVQVIFQNFIKHSQNSLSACHFYAKIVSNFY
jgi:hypothetical protein